jgi:flagellar basal-body rod protein FlgB
MDVNHLVYDDTTLLSTKMIDLTVARQQVIANNLANASTPNYIRKDLDFQGKLAEQVRNNDLEGGLSSVTGEVVDDNTEAPRMDGNNVNVATELNQLMKNGVLFNLLSKAYSTKMTILRNSMKSSA